MSSRLYSRWVGELQHWASDSCLVARPLLLKGAEITQVTVRFLMPRYSAGLSERRNSNPARFLRIRCEKSGASLSVLATGLIYACALSSEKGKFPPKFPPR